MKKIFYLLLVTCITTSTVAQQLSTLKKVVEFKMPLTAEDYMPGTRGASIVWHPVQKKYYSAFAGNKEYPMAVFNAAGKRLSPDEQTTSIDTRGLWYNPVKKQICGNAYGNIGWFSYSLNSLGMVQQVNNDIDGQNQPGEQSVGTYNIAKKQVIFLSGSEIWYYNADGTVSDNKTTIHWGRTAKDGAAEYEDAEETPEGYNNSSIIYTGLPNAEVGVMNITNKQIELYNSKTGFLSVKLQLPEDAPAEATFNFAFTNGMYFLFDMEKRTWIGYK